MKDYSFLKKPVFFVFNLVFATWLVLAIEKVKPSDFGEYSWFFEETPKPRKVSPDDKPALMKLAADYRYGYIDSVELDRRLGDFLLPIDEGRGTRDD